MKLINTKEKYEFQFMFRTRPLVYSFIRLCGGSAFIYRHHWRQCKCIYAPI